MSYANSGFPIEKASKIGQLRIINDTILQGLVQSFEAPNNATNLSLIKPTGNINLNYQSNIERVIAIDGGEAIFPIR